MRSDSFNCVSVLAQWLIGRALTFIVGLGRIFTFNVGFVCTFTLITSNITHLVLHHELALMSHRIVFLIFRFYRCIADPILP